MGSDQSQINPAKFRNLSEAEFFALMKKELGKIKKETDELGKTVHSFLDKAKEKQLLTDILDKY